VTDNAKSEGPVAAELAQRWIATMQSMADQIQRQQQAFQQMMQESMNSYMQLLNTPPFPLSGQPQEGRQAAQQAFQQASQQWMQLAQQQQEALQRMSQQWMEQAQQQQQAFQRIVQESLTTYTNLFRRPM
jgi:formiminotetrahydrofolate cyclodeaminase